MKKSLTKVFRRNEKKSRRKIKGGDRSTYDLFERLPALLEDDTINNETKAGITSRVIGELAVKINPVVTNNGFLPEIRYIIQNKIRNIECGYLTSNERCRTARKMIEDEKKRNKQRLTLRQRFRLRNHKWFTRISPLFLSNILVLLMEMFVTLEETHTNEKELIKTVLRMYFTNVVMEFDRLTSNDMATLKLYNPKQIPKKETLEQLSIVLSHSSTGSTGSTDPLPHINYDTFKSIIGVESPNDCIDKTEFDFLKEVYRKKYVKRGGSKIIGGRVNLRAIKMLLLIAAFVVLLATSLLLEISKPFQYVLYYIGILDNVYNIFIDADGSTLRPDKDFMKYLPERPKKITEEKKEAELDNRPKYQVRDKPVTSVPVTSVPVTSVPVTSVPVNSGHKNYL